MDIPQEHVGTMQAMCRLREDEPLPKKLSEKYWEFKRCMDRVQAPLQASDLARLCVECGYGKPLDTETKLPSVAEMWRKKKIKQGDKVLVDWRGETVNGEFRGVTSSNEILVVLNGEPEQRRFSVDRVQPAA